MRKGSLPVKLSIIVVVVIAACGLLTQFSPASAQSPAANRSGAKLTRVNYGQITIAAFNWPYLIADREGMFKQQGIDLQKIVGGNTASVSQALVAGGTDLAQMNLVQLLAANIAGADLVAVAGDVMVPIYTLIVAPSIKTYADLKGKRIAVAGPTDPLNYILQRMTAANKLTPADYQMVPVGGTPDRLSAVLKGAAAGSLISQPDDFRAAANGMGQLGRSTDFVDHFQYTVTAARREWLQKNKPITVRFLRAYVKGCEFFYDPKNREAAIRILMQETKADRDVAEKTYALYQQTRKTLPQHGEIDLAGSRIVAENWKEFGLQVKPPPVDGVIDLSYLKEAQK